MVPSRKFAVTAATLTGGERAAAIYSLIGTAKLNGIDPEAYLSRILARIADHPPHRRALAVEPDRLADG